MRTGTPPQAIAWANAEARKALASPEARQRFVAQGASLPLGTAAAFGAHVAAERDKWGEVIRRAGIKME